MTLGKTHRDKNNLLKFFASFITFLDIKVGIKINPFLELS